jgi:serine phosphatase RsbU (regulator of sigma subunit)
MPHTAEHLASTYRRTLARFVDAGEESQLEEAYELGRAACANGATILDLVDIHRQAVCALFDATPPSADGTTVKSLDASFGFLAEALATFEMTQRGYWEAHEAAQRERAVAAMLQRELMPTAAPVLSGLELAVRYLPGGTGTHAGGDWYDVFELPEGQVGLVVGDVTGHGVAAAATMGQLRIAVLAYALGGRQPREVVADLDVLVERLGTGDIATMVYVTLDRARQRLVVTSAGHPPPVVVAPDGTSLLVEGGHGRLLGVSPPPTDRSQTDVPVVPGSHVLMYTDGLVEPAERAGSDGLELLARATDGFRGTAEELCDRVLSELAPDGARDDICILAATVLG